MANNYFRVPNSIFTVGLTKYELVVLIYLLYHRDDKQNVFPGYREIAKCCMISRSKAIKVVNRLIKKGTIIKQIKPGSYRKNYTYLYHIALNVPKNKNT